jgi:hypothetical protein
MATGAFVPDTPFASPLLSMTATGAYIDEVTGAASTGPVTLKSYAHVGTETVLDVNVLTTLAFRRHAVRAAHGRTVRPRGGRVGGRGADARHPQRSHRHAAARRLGDGVRQRARQLGRRLRDLLVMAST